jgi:hypothetical protein
MRGTQYPRTPAELEAVLAYAIAHTYPVTISYWEQPKDSNGKPIKGAPLEDVLRTIEPYEIDTSKDGRRFVRAMTRITGEGTPGPRSYRLDRFGTYERGHLPGCITVHRTHYIVPRPDLINTVLAHAMEHYDKGWDVVVEAWETDELWEVIKGTPDPADAIERVRQIVDALEDRRAVDAQLWHF